MIAAAGRHDTDSSDAQGSRCQRVVQDNAAAWAVTVVTITAAGTGEQLASLAVPHGMKLILRGHPDNTGDVYIGASKANAESAAARATLKAGDAVELNLTNANLVWWNASGAGQKIEVIREVAS